MSQQPCDLMKRFMLIGLLAFPLSTLCQAPDWTLTSCDGDSYNFYEELASGRAVVMDFSAVWCNACVDHSLEMQEVYENFGFGNGEVSVFEFLFEDENHNASNCTDLEVWDEELGLDITGFVDCGELYLTYNELFGDNAVPIILAFIPHPGGSDEPYLVYNYIEGIGVDTGDVSADITSILWFYGFNASGISARQHQPKKLVKIVDMLGREVDANKNSPLIYIYDDGTSEKVCGTRQ
jgi:thiol-disulfide isomerase/thioredoxin